jgi:DNA-binding response OmpR family regulator
MARPSGAGAARTVLVTEDNPLHMKIFKLNLTFSGFTVLEAENGEKGVELARRERPDLILVDLSLPKLDGWAMISRIKDDEETRDIPIIVVSARRPQDEAAHAAMRHIAAYIPKPLDPEALMALVHETVASCQLPVASS